MRPSANIAHAFSVLGLHEGSSLELVKTTYKQIALRIHPDKNPDVANATAEFQRVSEAYTVLLNHLNQSSKTSSGTRPQYSGSPSHGSYRYGSSDDDEDFGGYDDYDYYEADSDSDDDIAFYLFLFQEMMNRRTQYKRPDHRTRRQERNESPEQYQERLRRSREEHRAAQEREKRENAARKERAAREREQERLEAEQRRRDKIEEKKAQANAARKSAADKAREIQRQAQNARSLVFAAARQGESDKVKKGIWENSVDPAGGEIKQDCSTFVRNKPLDLNETLLQIATKNGDLDLVKWLDLHSADPEERNSENMTAFHIALKMCQVDIAKYFFESYPPTISDSEAIYDCSKCSNLISLALESREPELVWLILDHKLATSQEIHDAWAWASSKKGRQTLRGEHPTPSTIENADDVIMLLERYGNIQNPIELATAPTPSNTGKSRKVQQAPTSPLKSQPPSPNPSYNNRSHPGRGNGRGRGRGRARSNYSPSH